MKNSAQTIFESTPVVFAEKRIDEGIYRASSLTKEITKKLNYSRDYASVVCYVKRKLKDVHRKPEECENNQHSHKHLEHFPI